MKIVALGAMAMFLLGGTAAAGVTTPQAKRDALKRCAPRQARSHRQIAVGLRLVGISARRGACPTSVAVIGGTAGDVWGFDWDGGLWESRDDLRTWRLAWQGPKDSFVERAMRTRSGHVLIEVGYSGSKTGRRIMRSTDTSARRFTTTFTLPLGSSLHFATSWGQFSAVGAPRNTIYVGEYGDHPNPVHLWASSNDGRSFKTMLSLPGQNTNSRDRVRHFHGVFLDPFTKWLWVAIGDTTDPRIGYSKDGGRTFTWITERVYPRSRAVGLLFAKDAVYWGTDVPEMPGALYRWSRATGAITTVLASVREPYFDARQSRGWYAQFSEISTKEDDGYIGDEHVHVLVGNRAGWRRVTTPWTRANKQNGKIAPAGVTSPDAAGCFWMSLPGLPRSDGFTNLKLCLGPTPHT